MSRSFNRAVLSLAILAYSQLTWAVEFEKKGTAIAKVLGTKKVLQKKLKVDGKPVTVFYSKEPGADRRLAIIREGIYEPDCTHTWVIGVNAKAATIEEIRVVEMSCPHAFPTQKPSFLDQFTGKGPASLKKIKEEISTVAKATGSSNLTTEAVVVSIKAAGAFQKAK